MPPAGPAFYARVYHPAYNVDKDDATDAIDRFDNHTRAVSKSVQTMRSMFAKVRDARIGALGPLLVRPGKVLKMIENRNVEGRPSSLVFVAFTRHKQASCFDVRFGGPRTRIP